MIVFQHRNNPKGLLNRVTLLPTFTITNREDYDCKKQDPSKNLSYREA